jgi:nitroimidazol reductase NimA-like FMN-containing flavoprotein (pyridoxamine 5'-phosphate oxidase superfamily)
MGFVELSRAECLELLAAKQVGRVAVTGPEGPQIYPVNYTMHRDGVLFRTAPYTQLAGLVRNAPAAFEVDDIDEFLESGWSVVVTGTATYVDDPDDLPDSRAGLPDSWAAGDRTLFVRIEPTGVTGRRVNSP